MCVCVCVHADDLISTKIIRARVRIFVCALSGQTIVIRRPDGDGHDNVENKIEHMRALLWSISFRTRALFAFRHRVTVLITPDSRNGDISQRHHQWPR